MDLFNDALRNLIVLNRFKHGGSFRVGMNIVVFLYQRELFVKIKIGDFTPSPYLLNSPIFLSLGRKSHLTSIVTQESDNGRKDQHHDEIDGTEDLWVRTPPEDEDGLKDKKKD